MVNYHIYTVHQHKERKARLKSHVVIFFPTETTKSKEQKQKDRLVFCLIKVESRQIVCCPFSFFFFPLVFEEVMSELLRDVYGSLDVWSWYSYRVIIIHSARRIRSVDLLTYLEETEW